MKHNAKLMAMTVVLSSVLVLSGCGTMSTIIRKRNPEVKIQVSETIWLESSSQKTVYLRIRNISDKDMSGLQAKVAKAVQDKGYTITSSPDSAYYWIQVNVLKADKMDLCTAQGFLSQGCEGVIAGAALGTGIIGYNSSSADMTPGVGLAAGLVGMAASAIVEDINYTMMTDIQISEKTTASVQTDNVVALKQDAPGYKVQASAQTSNQHKYQTRIVSSANKVSLGFEEAKPALENQLTKSIANILQYIQGGRRATLF